MGRVEGEEIRGPISYAWVGGRTGTYHLPMYQYLCTYVLHRVCRVIIDIDSVFSRVLGNSVVRFFHIS